MPDKRFLVWAFTNKGDDETDIDLFDVIGETFWGDGISAKDFVQQLRDVKTAKVNLHINSPGGYVSEGLAMYNAILNHSSHFTAFIEGQAASAASWIALAADEVRIAKTASVMIHDAQAFADVLELGNADDMRAAAADIIALANVLDEESQNIAGIYADRTGRDDADTWRAAMKANNGIGTTYRGQAAIDAGLAKDLIAAPEKRNLRNARRMAVANFSHLAIANLKATNDGKQLSQVNLDDVHRSIEHMQKAMDHLMGLHDRACDLGDDCPLEKDQESKLDDDEKDDKDAATLTVTNEAPTDFASRLRELLNSPDAEASSSGQGDDDDEDEDNADGESAGTNFGSRFAAQLTTARR